MILKTEQIHKLNHTDILDYAKAMSMSEIKRLLTERKKPMIGYKGYLYTVEKTKDDKVLIRYAAGRLPQTESLLRTIRRQRQAEPTTPGNRLPDQLKQTDRGENFVLHEDKDLIIFTTNSNLSVLKTCKHWFADGTFSVSPEDFYQMFTLHGLFKSQVIRLVYGLLIGKKTSDYDQFFQRIMEEDDFNPDSILTDFESATIKSVKSLFPNVLHKGCLFHFGQYIWRNIQSHGLQNKYQADKSFYLNVKKLIALAFVPILDVVKAFKLIVDDFDDDADQFLNYFEKTWIGERKRRGAGRKNPQFPIELWNIHDRITSNLPRSNNSIEGWHNAFAKRVSTAHPTITKLADKIRHEPKPKKAVYRKLDERITRLVGDYNSIDLGGHSKDLAANMLL
ncbi:unnamed protein product [Adineta ricciae]|uniref:MULE transposase domain-containing protein n=1 Tax=Adineta ricciae TaxID=249248 RepID=A0A814VTA0_ADIRI|nr:unnamed protein product [Adineta ricciae]